MDAIKQWTFSVCAAMVACGLAQMLLPKSSLEKMFKLVVSIFFLCCLLSPLVLNAPALFIDVDLDPPRDATERAERLSEMAEQQALSAVQSNLSRIVRENLEQKGINLHSITININTNGQGEAEVTAAEVVVDREHEEEREAIARTLRDEFGLDAELRFE